MILSHMGKCPAIAKSARIAPNAVICGDVEIGENCSVGFGCVLTAESGPIRIGRNSVIMDTAVLRGVRGAALIVGDGALIGPRAHLSGCTIGDGAFIATGATVLNKAIVETGAQVRINGVVHIRSRVSTGTFVPIGWVAVGDPAEIHPPGSHDEIWDIQRRLDFPGTVFKHDGTGLNGQQETLLEAMPRLMAAYARKLREHEEDRLVD